MRVKVVFLSLIYGVFISLSVFGSEGHQEPKGSSMQHTGKEASSTVLVGNKICPISGEKVDSMGSVVQYEHEGKIYNFCCASCVEAFKEDPQKYIKLLESGKKE